MRSFKDNAARNWLVEINVTQVKRVKAILQIDLLDLEGSDTGGGGGVLARLYDDPVFLVDLIWVLVSEQAEKAGITDEQFGRSLGGDALDQATEALVGALIDFFPGRRRHVLQKTVGKAMALQSEALDRAEQQIEQVTLDDLMPGN